jgi:hypothetical protein
MKKEDLVKLGIEDEATQKELFKLHGLAIEGLKEKNESLTSQVETLTGNLTEAQTTIESFSEKEMNYEEVKAAADEYKAKFEEAEAAKEQEIKQLRFDHKLNDSLKEAKARNLKAVRALLNMEQLTIGENGDIEGLSDQLAELQVENDFLFESEPEPEPEPESGAPKIVTGSVKRRILGDPVVQAAKEGAGLKK